MVESGRSFHRWLFERTDVNLKMEISYNLYRFKLDGLKIDGPTYDESMPFFGKNSKNDLFGHQAVLFRDRVLWTWLDFKITVNSYKYCIFLAIRTVYFLFFKLLKVHLWELFWTYLLIKSRFCPIVRETDVIGTCLGCELSIHVWTFGDMSLTNEPSHLFS